MPNRSGRTGEGPVSTSGGIETEIKLRFPGTPEQARRHLLDHGFEESIPRVFEGNDVYDTPHQSLRNRGELIRLRQAGTRNILTWKGKSIPGIHKSRPESEVDVSDFEQMRHILVGLGYELAFRYEKYRTEFSDSMGEGSATLDETPIGVFFELEGPSDWIDSAAARLGVRHADYVTTSYAGLYLEYCKEKLIPPTHMVFSPADNAGIPG
jgi:adenylate cyclase class 2